MQNTHRIGEGMYWVGGSDRRLALFENLFPLENGVSYNSYLLLSEKTALLDTVDHSVSQQFVKNVLHTLGGRGLNYLVLHHVEPDHASAISEIVALFPDVQIVATAKAFEFIGQFSPRSYSRIEVKEGDTLELGGHTLQFITAPMVHWPEVMVSYESKTETLFSADAFGTFGALSGAVFSDELDYARLYLDEARRYYANIVGKYGPQVQALLKKLDGTAVCVIAPLHGPLLRGDDIALMLEKYGRWSTYTPETTGVLAVYGSIYGNTAQAVSAFTGMLAQGGVGHIEQFDVSKTHVSALIAKAFEYSHILLAAPTYNMGLFGPMEAFLRDMGHLNLQNRDYAIIGNGTWAPVSHKLMQQLLEPMKNMRQIAEPLVIKSALGAGQQVDLQALADAVEQSVSGAR